MVRKRKTKEELEPKESSDEEVEMKSINKGKLAKKEEKAETNSSENLSKDNIKDKGDGRRKQLKRIVETKEEESESSSSSAESSSSEEEEEEEPIEKKKKTGATKKGQATKKAPAKGKAVVSSTVPETKKKRNLLVSMNKKQEGKKMEMNYEEDEKSLELAKELIEGHETLSAMQQRSDPSEPLPPQLVRLTTRLASADILTSENPRIGWLAGRCLADILFLHAPDAPFEDATLKRVFRVLVTSLRGLVQEETSEAAMAATYVLNRMAICKLGCVLVDLPEQLPGDGGIKTSELACELFDTVFDSIVPSHPISIETDAIELLAGYLDESSEDDYISLVLDSLLRRLLPENRKDSHRAFDVARSVIAKCSERIRSSLTSLINGMLLGRFERQDLMEEVDRSSVKDSVHIIVLELFRIDPNLLLHVIPSVENLLEVDDLDSRLKAVKLLTAMFLDITNDSLVDEYDELLGTLLKRSLDKCAEIRFVLIRFAGDCLTSQQVPRKLSRIISTRKINEDRTILEIGLHDSDTAIRKEAIEISSFLLSSPSSDIAFEGNVEAEQSLAQALNGRLRDVSPEHVLITTEGLAWTYKRNPAKFDWIPTQIFGSDFGDYQLNERKVTMIDTCMTGGKDASPEERVKRFRELYSHLSTTRSRSLFAKLVLRFRREIRTLVLEAIEQRKQKKKVELDKSLAKELYFLAVEEEKIPEFWKLVWNVPDNLVFEKWKEMLNPESTRKEMLEAKREVLERVGACLKSQKMDAEKLTNCKNFMKSITRWSGMWTLTADEFACEKLYEAESEIVLQFVEYLPEYFARKDVLGGILEIDNATWQLRFACSVCCHADLNSFPQEKKAIQKTLLGFTTIEDSKRKKNESFPTFKMRKLATKGILKLTSNDKDIVDSLLFRKEANWNSSDIYVAITIAKNVPEADIPIALVEDCVEKLKKPYSPKLDEEEIRMKIAGLKLITEYLLRNLENPSDEKLCRSLLLMMRSFVADLGDPWKGQANRQKKSDPLHIQWPPSNDECYIKLRLVSSTGLMKLEAKAPKSSTLLLEGDSSLNILKRLAKRLTERSRLAFDPDQECRRMFHEKLIRIDLENGLQMHRDGAFLCVIASLFNGSTSSNRAMMDLKDLVNRLAEASKNSSDKKKAVLLAPELILPNLVYILAHHPKFPTDETEFGSFLKSNQEMLTRPICTLLDALLHAHGKSEHKRDSSISFMLGILTAIRSRRDVLDDNHGIHCVGDLARLVIQQHAKYTPAALEAYKDLIPLPKVFLEIENSGEPQTPKSTSSNKSVAPSPISYLPAGFELLTSSAKKASRKSTGSTRPKKKKKMEPKISVSSSRRQPKRATRSSIISYTEEDSSGSSGDSSESEE